MVTRRVAKAMLLEPIDKSSVDINDSWGPNQPALSAASACMYGAKPVIAAQTAETLESTTSRARYAGRRREVRNVRDNQRKVNGAAG